MIPDEPGWPALGLAVGHATDEAGATGCTVIRGIDHSFRCAAHLLGRASGTRELAVCQPDHVTDRVDAVFLTGGSAYGLDAAAGVMQWMESRGRGYAIGSGVVPIVPGATIFDLTPLGQFSARPTAEMAFAACEDATSDNVPEGSVGAGAGATVGKIAGAAFSMKGGVGCGHARNNTVLASAIVVTNALGDVRDAHGVIIAGARTAEGGFADGVKLLMAREGTAHETTVSAATASAATASGATASGATADDATSAQATMRGNTTIALVAVNALLTKVQLAQVAAATSAAFYRRITPCGTSFDGDVIFAVCPPNGISAPLPTIEALAVAAMEQAIERSVRFARGRDGIPGLGDLHVDD